MSSAHDLITLTARYVFPVAGPPIERGCVVIRGERIEAVETRSRAGAIDLGDVAILPGLVNTHTHLEFSHFDAPLGRAGMPLPEWIRLVVAARRSAAGDSAAAIARGLAECSRAGTTAMGEISTAGWSATALRTAPADLVAFYETIGLSADVVSQRLEEASAFVDRVQGAVIEQPSSAWRGGVSPHAPYSVHPELVVALARMASGARMPVAMHLAESREELELLATGAGPFRDLLIELGAWDAAAIPRGTRVLEYLQILAATPRSLVIHGNYLAADELEFVAMNSQRMSIVYCPRTHAYFAHDRYPLARLLKLGAAVALGTDSRASNPDLNLLSEMRFVAKAFPEVPPADVLRLGTFAGAQALGYADVAGTLEAGKLANLCVVPLPARGGGAGGRDPHELLFESNAVACDRYYRGRRIV